MPAAAVIPAPIAYIKVAAVKKLVVGSRVSGSRSALWACTAIPAYRAGFLVDALHRVSSGGWRRLL